MFEKLDTIINNNRTLIRVVTIISIAITLTLYLYDLIVYSQTIVTTKEFVALLTIWFMDLALISHCIERQELENKITELEKLVSMYAYHKVDIQKEIRIFEEER